MAKRKRKYEYHTPESEAKAKANLPQYRKKTIEEIEKEAREFQRQKKKLKDLNIIEFAENPAVLGLSFARRPAQKMVLKSIYGEKLTEEELKIYQKITTNREEFEAGIEKEEAILIFGTRSGKSLLASIIALYEATRPKWLKYLNKDEAGYVVVVSTRQRQSEQIIGANCLRLLLNSPTLKGYIKDSTMSELTLKNNMKIVSSPCTSFSYRGIPIFCLITDEIGHFFVEGPKADSEILNALMPRMSQFPGAKLILISTPSAKQGSLWNYYEQGFRVPGRLTAQADTLFMNPLVDRKFLEKEKKRDVDNWQREYLAQFAEKVEAFLSYDLVVSTLKLAGDLPFVEGNRYYAGIDASGLSGRDKFALAVSHQKDNIVYVDKTKIWDLKDPDPIMRDIGELAGIYNFNSVSIDRYAKGWVMNALEKIGLTVTIRPTLAEVYVNLKSLMIGDRLHLPDNEGVKKALLNTQAYYGKSNALSIAHERDSEGHSDIADAIATSVFSIVGEGSGARVRWIGGDDEDDENWQKINNWNDIFKNDNGDDLGGPLKEDYHQI
ncbi:hypothetical protein ES705_35778 [subsurface metagenome]